MARLLLIAIMAMLALLPDGIAYNHGPCASCVTPTPTPKPRIVICDTPEPTPIIDCPLGEPCWDYHITPEPTKTPPGMCIQECKAACKEAGLKWKDCKDDCDCLGGE